MADAAAKRSAPEITRPTVRALAVMAALAVAGCNGALLNLDGGGQQTGAAAAGGQPGVTDDLPVDHMSTAIAIRDAACYSDFELANAAIESKLSDSIRNITVSGDVGENALRDEMILGLRFNANLQKRLAFDTLEECLR